MWEQFYGKRNAMNAGISGDRTQHVLWRLEKHVPGEGRPGSRRTAAGRDRRGARPRHADGALPAGGTPVQPLTIERQPSPRLTAKAGLSGGSGGRGPYDPNALRTAWSDGGRRRSRGVRQRRHAEAPGQVEGDHGAEATGHAVVPGDRAVTTAGVVPGLGRSRRRG